MSKHTRTSLLQVRLVAAEAAAIAERFRAVRPPIAGDVNRWVRDLRQAGYEVFPPRLLDALEEMRRGRSVHAGLHVTGLPIDANLPRTPKKGADVRASGKGWLSESVLVAVAGLVGEPYSVTPEATGLVSELIPLAAARGGVIGTGFGVELSHHIENAALRIVPGLPDLAPLGLVLLGLRGEPVGGPRTLVADGRAALSRLPSSTVAMLWQPRYRIAVPKRWLGSLRGLPEEVAPSPVVFGSPEAPVFAAALYGELTVGLDEEADRALAAFRAALSAVEIGVRIDPGECVYVSNTVAFHARETFEARFDDEGHPFRWLQRVFVCANLGAYAAWDEQSERLFAPKL